MNNQQAVLTFAENSVYFTLQLDEQNNIPSGSTTTDKLTIKSDIRTVPIGVIMTLQPSINLDTNEITMNIRPTLSRITSRIQDPGVAIIANRLNTNITSEVPIVEVRELDSILRIKSGQVMVIGGLMEERSVNTDVGLPGFQRIPIAGNLFKSKSEAAKTVETVIFIKATIIPGAGGGMIHEDDKNFYKTFANDSHPLTF